MNTFLDFICFYGIISFLKSVLSIKYLWILSILAGCVLLNSGLILLGLVILAFVIAGKVSNYLS